MSWAKRRKFKMSPRPASHMEHLDRRYRPALMSFFLRRIRDHAEAEDLTQEVFVRVSASGGGDENPDGYIFQAAANLLRDRGRRAKVRNAYRDAVEADAELRFEQITPGRVLDAKQSLDKVVRALRDLPERTRAIFILYRLENMKQRDIGEMFGISASAVEKHVVKAMAAISRARGDDQ
jgi:RNA polymerase sigma factor (sigma-70 family)